MLELLFDLYYNDVIGMKVDNQTAKEVARDVYMSVQGITRGETVTIRVHRAKEAREDLLSLEIVTDVPGRGITIGQGTGVRVEIVRDEVASDSD